MHEIFICHAHQDKDTADAICLRLERDGIKCWIAPRNAPVGGKWAGAIMAAIDACQAVVLVFSSSANSSEHVNREVQEAFETRKTVIPYKIENITPTDDLRYYLNTIHWLDALSGDTDENLDQLADVVSRVLSLRKEVGMDLREPDPAPALEQEHAPVPPPIPVPKPIEEAKKADSPIQKEIDDPLPEIELIDERTNRSKGLHKSFWRSIEPKPETFKWKSPLFTIIGGMLMWLCVPLIAYQVRDVQAAGPIEAFAFIPGLIAVLIFLKKRPAPPMLLMAAAAGGLISTRTFMAEYEYRLLYPVMLIPFVPLFIPLAKARVRASIFFAVGLTVLFGTVVLVTNSKPAIEASSYWTSLAIGAGYALGASALTKTDPKAGISWLGMFAGLFGCMGWWMNKSYDPVSEAHADSIFFGTVLAAFLMLSIGFQINGLAKGGLRYAILLPVNGLIFAIVANATGLTVSVEASALTAAVAAAAFWITEAVVRMNAAKAARQANA